MNRKLIVALACGALAAGLNFFTLSRAVSERRGGDEVELIVTLVPLAAGQRLTTKELGTLKVPEAFADPRALRSSRLKEVLGLPLAVALESGAHLCATDLVERPGSRDDLARMVPAGGRAVTIPVDQAQAVGGMLRAGHRVDLIGTFTRPGESAERTLTLMQNVVILAVGAAAEGARAGSVTLAMSLEEAELVALARRLGTLSVVLRGADDLEIVRELPEKSGEDLWRVDRRDALAAGRDSQALIERLRAR